MKFEEIKKRIPWFPFSVLIFYLVLLVLWNVGIIPTPEKFIDLAEILVKKIGIIGISIATFIEGLAFIGHQFPGMTILIISMVVTGNNFSYLASIIAAVSIALTLSSVVNYYAGTFFSKKKDKQQKHKKMRSEKTFFLSMLHPTFLSLYFFHRGIKRKGLKEIFLVPVLMFPYGLLIALIISQFSGFIRNDLLTSDLFFLVIFIGWFAIEFYSKNKNFCNKEIKKIKNK